MGWAANCVRSSLLCGLQRPLTCNFIVLKHQQQVVAKRSRVTLVNVPLSRQAHRCEGGARTQAAANARCAMEWPQPSREWSDIEAGCERGRGGAVSPLARHEFSVLASVSGAVGDGNVIK